MKFKIKMVTNPGDKTIVKGVITKIDAKGVESTEQMILEGETVEVDCVIGDGEALKVRELEPPVIIEDMATKPMTWEHVAEKAKAAVADRPPPTEPEPKHVVTPPKASEKAHESYSAKK